MVVQGFAVKLGVLLGASNHQCNAVGVGFHHDADRLGLGQAGDRLH